MGRLVNGLNGHVSGKVGSVVGSSWKGIPYVKARYKKRTTKITKTEAANRSRFGAAHYWLKPLTDFVRHGFKGYTPTVEGFLAAKSYLMKNAMQGADIDPALMLVSYGELQLAEDIAVEKSGAGHLKFTWDTDISGNAHPRDQVMLLAYDIAHETAFYTTTGQFRSVGEDILEVDGRRGRTYHIYFAFTAPDRTMQSNSVYLGTLKF